MMPLQITAPGIEELWDAMADLPYCQADFAPSKDAFTALLMSPQNLFFEFERGFVSFLNVQPRASAIIKVTMFDKQLRGREQGVVDLLLQVVDAVALRRVTALVPQELRVLQKFFMRIGFRHEGRMRHASPWGSDVHIYGILEKELGEWHNNQDPGQETMCSPVVEIPLVPRQDPVVEEAEWTGHR